MTGFLAGAATAVLRGSVQQVVVTAQRMTQEEREALAEWDREMKRFDALRAQMHQ